MLALLSGGIDSAVACYLMAERVEMEYFHLSTDNSLKKAGELVSKIDVDKKIIYTLDHSYLMHLVKDFMIESKISENYTCIYCKRGMLKSAELLAEKIGCDAIVTGDNLGQVASQTLRNLYAVDIAVKIPVIRPLIGMDKEEITEIAKKAGTYEISIRREEKCRYLPRRPITEAKDRYLKDFNVDSILDKIRVLEVF